MTYFNDTKIDAAYALAMVGALLGAGIPIDGIEWAVRRVADYPAPSTVREAAEFARLARSLYDQEFGPKHG